MNLKDDYRPVGPVGGVLRMVRIKQVSCGWNHSLAVTPNGLLFAWGFNFHGELGIGSKDDSDEPKEVQGLLGLNVSYVSAGQFHSAAVTECGKLFTWGHNKHGRLLRFEETLPNSAMVKNCYFPQEVKIENEGNQVEIVKVDCGLDHTLVID